MRLLLDANLSPRIVAGLKKAGHDASHVVEHGLLAATDDAISRYAVSRSSAIVSADSDFATMLALTGAVAPSLILLRSVDRLTPDQQCALLLANFSTLEAELLAGAIVSLSRDHLRVRRLPITRS